MRRAAQNLRPLILGVVALALAALVVLQYWPAGPPAPVATPPKVTAPKLAAPKLAAPKLAAPKLAEVTLNPMSQRQAADFAPLFDHPLFAPSRTRPVVDAPVDATPPAPVAEALVPEAPAGPPQPVLMGTVTSPWPGGAYLGDDAGGPVFFLRPGQEALGLHLEEVRAHSAIFMSADGEVTLELRKIAPPESAPPENAPLQNAPPAPDAGAGAMPAP
jgi:hypothetical protein